MATNIPLKFVKIDCVEHGVQKCVVVDEDTLKCEACYKETFDMKE